MEEPIHHKTEKKKQHYVPKLYLRNFSNNEDRKTVSVYRLETQQFIPSASIDSQGMANYYYGEDGKIEDELAILDNQLAPALNACLTSKYSPHRKDNAYRDLILFTILTDLRNPVRHKQLEVLAGETKERYITEWLENFKGTHIEDAIKTVDLPNFNPILEGLKRVNRAMLYVSDLKMKLIINQTSIPLISSDYPVFLYNEFLIKHEIFSFGYGSPGLQIIFPISPRIALIYYDAGIYNIGKKQDKTVFASKEDVKNLNLMQVHKAYKTVLGNHQVTEAYFKKLHKLSKERKNEALENELFERKAIPICFSFTSETPNSKKYRVDKGIAYNRLHVLRIDELIRQGYFNGKIILD